MGAVKWTALALENVNDIAEYIAKDSQRYASAQVERFFERTQILEDFPNSGRIVPELEDEKIRELICGSFRIIYRIVSDKQIDIVTVHHTKRILSNNLLL